MLEGKKKQAVKREFQPLNHNKQNVKCFPTTMKITCKDHRLDGRNPAPPKKPWNDDSPVSTNKQLFPILSEWCRISSIHSRASLFATVLDGNRNGPHHQEGSNMLRNTSFLVVSCVTMKQYSDTLDAWVKHSTRKTTCNELSACRYLPLQKKVSFS